MKGWLAALVVLGVAGDATAGDLRATFIGNEAVHLTDGALTLLVDFPYESGAFGYMSWARDTIPQGRADACLISHGHVDHFAPRRAAEFCDVVIGPASLTPTLGVERVELGPGLRWRGLTIRAEATRHGDSEHFSLRVEWGNARLYFTGDTTEPAALLAQRDLDVAFVNPWVLAAVARQKKRIDARQVVVYHHTPGESVPAYQERLVPAQGEVIPIASLSSDGVAAPASSAAVPTVAVTAPDPFEAALREAEDNEQAGRGGPFQSAFNEAVGAAYAPRLNECARKTGGLGKEPIDVLLKLRAEGTVQDALVRPRTPLGVCFLELSRTASYPKPPRAGFWTAIRVRFGAAP